MKRKQQTLITIFSLIFLAFFTVPALAVNYPGDYTIEDTADIAALSGYTGITGNLLIGSQVDMENPPITTFENLTGLENLITIGGDLRIVNNNALISLIGLNNLTFIGGSTLMIENNESLIDISALSSLDAICLSGELWIEDNPNLTSLNGLAGITCAGDFGIGTTALTSLNGLEGLTFVSEDMWIGYNDALINLCGLYNVHYAGETLSISSNQKLSMLTVNALETQLRSNGFTGTVESSDNNGSGLVSCQCTIDANCGNEFFCDGTETCEAGSCVAGTNPCAEGQTCDEEATTCVTPPECTIDANCGNEVFCDGTETCAAGSCVAGTNPCTEGQTCDEEANSCVTPPECTIDANCGNEVFCDGTETCAAGSCVAGTNPCEAGETCNEGIDECSPEVCDVEWDLDGDCDVDKVDANLLKLRHKAEKTDLSNRHKAEKAAMKAAL